MVLAKLAEEMTQQKMRPEDLAAKTGLSIRTILNARDGKSVSLGTASLIAQKLKMRAEALT
jgi:transcriptional regulator with XRE-family HTH domain